VPPQTPRDPTTGVVSGLAGPAAWGRVVTPIVHDPQRRCTRRNRELDVYIAIAVVASVVFTVYQFCNVGGGLYRGTPVHAVLASLDAAVPFFFVLIGFEVFRPIVAAYLEQAPLTAPPSFPARRAAAVVPAYYTVITVVWFCRQQRLPGDWRDLLEHLSFTQVFDGKRIFYTDGPAWAVSVTVFFLVLLAIVDVGLSRFPPASTRTRRLMVLGLPAATLTATSVGWKAWSVAGAHRSTGGSPTTWYGPLANLDNFALGMTVALTLASLERMPVRASYRVGLRVGALVAVAAAVAIRTDGRWFAAYFTTMCSLGFAGLLTAATLTANNAITADTAGRSESWRSGSYQSWVSGCVAVAYGTYLWREPVLLALNGWDGLVVQKQDAFIQDTLVVLVVSLLIGAMSHLAIEQPALQLYQLATTRRPHEPLASTVGGLLPDRHGPLGERRALDSGSADVRSSPTRPSENRRG
jgi:hypothetical protein